MALNQNNFEPKTLLAKETPWGFKNKKYYIYVNLEPNIIAVVTLRTFALGKLDLLTVLPRETSI